MQLLRLLFNSNSAASINSRAGKIMSVFLKTQNDLQALNSDIDLAVKEKQDEAERIAADIQSLQATKAGNDKVISKISNFLND